MKNAIKGEYVPPVSKKIVIKLIDLFLILFTICFFVYIPMRAMDLAHVEYWEGVFGLVLGIWIVFLILVGFRIAKRRWASFLIFFFYIGPAAYSTRLAVIVIMAFVGCLVFIGWLKKYIVQLRAIFRTRQVKPEQLKKGGMMAATIVCLILPGILPLALAPLIRIPIKPQNYQIHFNFWAASNINATYPEEYGEEYSLSGEYYTPARLAAFNMHKVNLDLTFNAVTEDIIPMLIEWEKACPDITYRITLYPSAGLATLFDMVKNATEILMSYEANYTLDQWIGFAFDIEGTPYTYYSGMESFEAATDMWNDIFDFIDGKSAIRGKQIEMECIPFPYLNIDLLDGDNDLQEIIGNNGYCPDRFTTYAPMLYRCWYKGDKPYGSPQNPFDPWPTSYFIYNQLYQLNLSVGADRMGFYIGLTNCSCYSRDLPQPESVSWSATDTNTGLMNLFRDTLIAKHFGVKEITFFISFTAIERGYSMGGVFDSYGDDFLDVLNTTVNTNPPESFEIFYNLNDARGLYFMQLDWLANLSHIGGWIWIIGYWIGAILIMLILKARSAHREKGRQNDILS